MKKLLLALSLLAVVGTANAQWHHGGHHGGGYYRGGCHGCGWIAPAIIGGAVVYGMTRPQVVQQPPVVVIQQPNQMIVPYAAPQGFHWEQILDANCNCYRTVLVQG